jgi:hypothetical protein
MKKFSTFAIISLILLESVSAQLRVVKVCFLAKVNKKNDWYCLSQKETKDDSLASIVVNDLVRPLGLRTKFLMRECNEIQNFAALVAERTQARYIVYNKAMIDSIADQNVRHWDQIAIYLHELAHHLNGNTANPHDNSTYQQELDADEFSGQRMAQLNATLDQAQHYLSLIENPPCEQDLDYGHPCLIKRLDAVARGWYEGKGMSKFYNAMLDKMALRGRIIKNLFDRDEYLITERFFEHDHCIRSLDNECRVTLNEIELEIGIKDSVAKLTINLTDWSDIHFGKLDTTIVYQEFSKVGIGLLPGAKFSVEFPMHGYEQTLLFSGVINSNGEVIGKLESPNEHGASWAPVPNERGPQLIAKIKLHPQ